MSLRHRSLTVRGTLAVAVLSLVAAAAPGYIKTDIVGLLRGP